MQNIEKTTKKTPNIIKYKSNYDKIIKAVLHFFSVRVIRRINKGIECSPSDFHEGKIKTINFLTI